MGKHNEASMSAQAAAWSPARKAVAVVAALALAQALLGSPAFGAGDAADPGDAGPVAEEQAATADGQEREGEAAPAADPAATPAAPTAPAAGAGAQGAAPATPAPLVTDAGTEVIDENETPLVAPREESLDDAPVPLAALPSDVAGANAGEQGARPWPAAPFLAAAAVLAAVVAVILIRARRKAAEE